MSPTLEKNFKKLVFFIALTLLASLMLRLWHATDHEATKSRAFISTNKEVKAAVGNIVGIDIKKKFIYQGTTSEPGYVEFTYYVRGSGGNIRILVRGYGEPTKYNVYRIRNL